MFTEHICFCEETFLKHEGKMIRRLYLKENTVRDIQELMEDTSKVGPRSLQ